jgi:hypothetical protein
MIYMVSKYLKIVMISFVVTLSGCALTTKLNMSEGIRSFQVQDYRRAFIKLKPEADRGNPQAQYAVGYMYFYGQGVVEDRKQALYWIRCAAKAKYPDAVAAMKILAKKPK